MRTAVLVLLTLLLVARPARAIPYETFIDVDDEGDLQDLLAAGTITQDTFDELLDLLNQGVDLTKADRGELYTLPNLTYEDVDAIIAYRDLQKGRIADPAELVTSGALSEEKLLAIAAFLIVREPGQNPLAARGWIRATTRATPHDFSPYSPSDPFIPPVGLRARFVALRYLTAGIAMTNTRLEIGEPVYDPNRGALLADGRSNQLHVPKAYVMWDTKEMTAIVGTFRAGFGQRLVFDNSRHYNPNGLYLDDELFYAADLASACKQSAGELLTSPCTGDAGSEYVTPDFGWRDGLLGVGMGIKRLELAQGWLQGFAWASASRRSIYQYELVDRGKCADPHDDSDPDCGAPVVYVRNEDNLLAPTTRHSFATLPNVMQERLAGANIGYFADRRNSVGLTGYVADEVNLVGGIDLDLQEWSRLPYGGRFGAIGGNFSFGRSWFDLFGEAALSFDSMGKQDPTLTDARGGGGPAALLRMTATRKKEELEVVARYYSTDFVNPFSRPISQADEFEGQRARDEAGGRIRYVRSSKDFTIRSLLDVWTNPSTLDAVKLDTYVRANVRTTDVLWLGLWERYQDKDLSRGGHDQCFEISNDTDENGEPIPCAGRQLSTIARGQYEPNRQLQLTVQLEHQLLDDNTQMELENKFRQDIAAWLIGYYRPDKNTRIRARVRYLDEAIHDNTYLERSIAALAEYATRVRTKDTLRVRVDSKFWLDKRTSTTERVPNPELSLWLFYEAKL
ncbi:MAG: hypothetical protein HOV81_28265 [Kofleriaceae bacterium]|nr:hypothetical protein [Kofleriaceae bacterium]